LYKIDKSFVDNMNYNKSFVVISNNETSKDTHTTLAATDKNSFSKDGKPPVLSAKNKSITNNDAKPTISNPVQETQEIKESAYRQGYENGIAQANKDLAASIQAETQKVQIILNNIEAYKQEMFNDLQGNVLELSLDIAEKIVNIQLKRDDKVYVGIIKKAIAKLKLAEKFVLRVSRTEYEQYFKHGARWLQEELECGPFEVVSDPYLEENSAVIESDEEIINAGVQVQLNKIRNSLNEKVAHDGQAL